MALQFPVGGGRVVYGAQLIAIYFLPRNQLIQNRKQKIILLSLPSHNETMLTDNCNYLGIRCKSPRNDGWPGIYLARDFDPPGMAHSSDPDKFFCWVKEKAEQELAQYLDGGFGPAGGGSLIRPWPLQTWSIINGGGLQLVFNTPGLDQVHPK